AAHVLGYSTYKTLVHIIMPQALKNILPALVNETISLIKESSIFASIGLLEITRAAINISAKTLDPMSIYLAIALIYLFLTTTISLLAKKWEKKLGAGYDHN
ncbi:MAG: ABC transporter permease subunit, partial [bacterium]